MSTIFDIRNLRLPKLSRTSVIIGSLVVVLALVVGYVGWQLYQKLTNNTVVAYFPAANALYPGDKVQIMGLRVGAIDKIEPAGDKMKVTFHYANKYKVPANASAVILNPTLVASRAIQLEPPYKGGPVLADNAVIPEERTQVPVEWDQLRNSITNIISKLGPTKEQPTGPFGEVISVVRRRTGRQGQADQRDAEQPVAGVDRAERGPWRLLCGGAQPGAVRQRAAPGRPAVRRVESEPG